MESVAPTQYPSFDFGPPPDRKNKRDLRPYQVEAVETTIKELERVRATMIVMATGLGKSVILGEIAARTKGRVLVLSHRLELVKQVRDHLWDASGEWVGIEQGLLKGGEARLISSSVQTMVRRYKKIDPYQFELIIVDEAHHAAAQSYRKILSHFNSKVIGVTATPDRADGEALRCVAESVAYQMKITRGIDDGWLVPMCLGEQRAITGISLENIRKTAGDLEIGQLDNEILNARVAIARDLVANLPNNHSIVFTPGVSSARLICAAINELFPDAAVEVDGETEEAERSRAFASFKEGKARFFVNCAIATEGVDLPIADTIIMCRPTLSRALYTQMVGRGLRPEPGVVDKFTTAEERKAAIAASSKPHCLLVDYVDNSKKHDLAWIGDVLGEEMSPGMKAAVKSKVKKASVGTEPIDVRKAIEEARRVIREQAARKVKAKEVKVEKFNPLAVLSVTAEPNMGARDEPPTPSQFATLLKFKVKEDEIRTLNRRTAKALLDKLFVRARLGLATFAQVRLIKKCAQLSEAEIMQLSLKQASVAIDRISSFGWRRGLTAKQLGIATTKDEPVGNRTTDDNPAPDWM